MQGEGERIVAAAIELVKTELKRAFVLHQSFSTHHQGYAVILEELDELKAEVWKRRAERDPARVIAEATQVAAMAVRFMVDLHGGSL